MSFYRVIRDDYPRPGGSFQISFDSGYTVSVAFNALTKDPVEKEGDSLRSPTGEVAVWKEGRVDRYVLFRGACSFSPTHPFTSPDELMEILSAAQKGDFSAL